jgi:abequosyltransferase
VRGGRPLLTVAVPTYGRAALLAEQLEWVGRAIVGHEDRCEVVVSDNCSPDDTAQVVARWCGSVPEVAVEYRRQPRNLGAVRNIMSCVERARGRFVWVVSDDDVVDDGALAAVLSAVEAHPSLGLLLLNFSSWDAVRQVPVFDRCFEVGSDGVVVAGDARGLLEEMLGVADPARWGGVGLTTAQVVRTDVACRALAEWRAAHWNFAAQLYVAAYCARHGGAMVTGRTWLRCTAGTHYFSGDEVNFVHYFLGDVSAAFARLARIGYDRHLVLRQLLRQGRSVGRPVARGLVRRPGRTGVELVRYATALATTAA